MIGGAITNTFADPAGSEPDDAAGAERLQPHGPDRRTGRTPTTRSPAATSPSGSRTATSTPAIGRRRRRPTTSSTRIRRRASPTTASSAIAGLNTIRFSVESEHIRRGAEPGDFLDNNDKTLEAPIEAHLSFDQFGHPNGQRRFAQAPGLDDSFSWFLPGKRGDHDLKAGFQYLYGQNELSEQGSMNGIFTFSTDRAVQRRRSLHLPGAADHPRALARRPVHARPLARVLRAGQVAAEQQPDGQHRPALRRGHRAVRAALQPAAGRTRRRPTRTTSSRASASPTTWMASRCMHGGVGRYYEKLFIGQVSPIDANGVFGNSFIVNFPVASADPGPSQGRLPTDPMLVNGPVVNRTLLNQLYPAGTLTRNTATVQYDIPNRQLPRSTQVSFGYSRQFATTMFWAADYVHNQGKGWLAYDLNPGLRVNTTRTGAIVRTDLLGLASQLGIAPFANSVASRFEYDGRNQVRRAQPAARAAVQRLLGCPRQLHAGLRARQPRRRAEPDEQLPAARSEESRSRRRTARHRPPSQPDAQRPRGRAVDQGAQHQHAVPLHERPSLQPDRQQHRRGPERHPAGSAAGG